MKNEAAGSSVKNETAGSGRKDAAGGAVTAIKVCGLTRPQDVALCRELGAAYLGFNFSSRSPRSVAPASRAALLDASGDSFRVGIFVDEPEEQIR